MCENSEAEKGVWVKVSMEPGEAKALREVLLLKAAFYTLASQAAQEFDRGEVRTTLTRAEYVNQRLAMAKNEAIAATLSRLLDKEITTDDVAGIVSQVN